jgi:carboxyl-terminal processing protease
MLPDDPNTTSTDAAPNPAPETAVTPTPELPPVPEPHPDGIGYVVPPAPVTVGGRGPRRSTVLAAALVVVALIGGGALFISGYSLGREQALAPGATTTEQQDFKAFFDTYHAIRDQYALEKVPSQKLVEGAIKGMVESIGDPYSEYLTPEDYQSSIQSISGQFEGIGVEVGTVDSKGATTDCNVFGAECRFVVIAPIEGSPAEAAGIKAGDVFTAVDGKTLDGLSPDQARDLIRGKAGTTVEITVQRGTTAPFDVTITRAKIQRQDVSSKDLADGSVGYVKLAGFSDAGADAFIAAVKADVAKGQKKLVIDLRGNPGGFITDAQKIASVFIKSGPVFWEQFADGHLQEWDATGDGVATDPSIKIMLLVDKGSASASEIVAGALRDTKRATLVGETTFGKGTVQQWIPLDDAGAVKLTVAKWLTPNKDWIHKIGIDPDVPVTVPTDLPEGQDPILAKALSLLSAAGATSEGWLIAA